MQHSVEVDKTQADDGYSWLRDGIVTGRFMPSERLVEADLAQALGVSRAHVRALLARLEQEGLVERQPNRGARVRLVPLDEAVELLEARAALESLAAHHAALRATPADVDALRALLDDMRGHLDRGDLLAYSAINAELHRKLLDISRHGIAHKLVDLVRAQLVRYQYRTVLAMGRMNQSMEEHRSIIEAVGAHQAEAAEAAMRMHLLHAVETLRGAPGDAYVGGYTPSNRELDG
jgi:DNA-binding GntR family transcriptional regulator